MQVSDVKTREDFVRFIETLSRQRRTGPGGWANPDLADYLRAVADWASHMEQFYGNTRRTVPQDINWQFIATLFQMGKSYE